MWIKHRTKSSGERAIIGFDHGLPCRVKNMALGPQWRQKPRPSASVFVYRVPQAMFFTRHGTPWSNPTAQTTVASNAGVVNFYSTTKWSNILQQQWTAISKLPGLQCHCDYESVRRNIAGISSQYDVTIASGSCIDDVTTAQMLIFWNRVGNDWGWNLWFSFF